MQADAVPTQHGNQRAGVAVHGGQGVTQGLDRSETQEHLRPARSPLLRARALRNQDVLGGCSVPVTPAVIGRRCRPRPVHLPGAIPVPSIQGAEATHKLAKCVADWEAAAPDHGRLQQAGVSGGVGSKGGRIRRR